MNATAIATQNIRTCTRCGIKYDWRRSASTSLKMTYCNSLCENADLGFTIEALIHTELSAVGKSGTVEVDWGRIAERAWAA